jgi:glycosyltransferase involved in cell wall biosynthesis
MEIIISIIIPVYNAEKYLIACLDSVLNQSFKSFELLLINDASTDSSYGLKNKTL